MAYYIFIDNGVINGSGQSEILNAEVINHEVTEAQYNEFNLNPDCYVLIDGVPTLDQNLLAQKQTAQVLSDAKDDRAVAVEAINATVNGNIYDGDEISQGRMARAVVFAMVRADLINRERRLAYEQAIAGLTPEEAETVPKPVYDDYLDYTTPWVTEDNQVIQTTIGQLGTAGAESMLIQADLWTVPYE